jgi:hypothetical protein
MDRLHFEKGPRIESEYNPLDNARLKKDSRAASTACRALIVSGRESR